MAISLLTGPLPRTATLAAAGTGCTQIRTDSGLRVKILADAIIYIFNGVADGGTAALAADRIELTAAEAAQGYEVIVGGHDAGNNYATVCIAAATGTASVRVTAEPSGGTVL